ncbi:MAG: phosphatidylserine/phosphatidylglycerophosphate/cardiolipin synthase family protein [Aeromicrobium sp.]|uniref:phospholipase D-like domain-containing protein n=1 Tax=Aeromicrobium sp. TaxID=1871063 RepID=UPI003C3803A0
MGVRRSTRELFRRGLVGFLLLQVVAVVSLMGADRIRRMVRGSNVDELSPTVPRDCTLADGSELTTYTYGASLFEDMIEAIDGARERVLLETYIIKNDATGREFKQALIAAAERGVDVRVVYDGFANLVVRPSFFDFPPPVRVFRYPLWNGGWSLPSPRRLGRDHRKILVVDDTAAFVGGYNVGALYATEWRDTHVRVTGRSVWDLDNAFIDFWNANATVARRPHGPLKSIGTSSWDTRIRAHRNVPRQLIYPIRAMYLEAIDRAHQSIDITAAYFIPDHDILEGLLLAASRGIKVRILTPKVSNHVVTDWLSRGFYGRLLRGGVEIHHYQGHMVHAKTATIDGQWSTIGTANIDRLSLQGNYEINLEILDPGFAEGMRAIFEDDLLKAKPLTLAEWNSRPWVAKLYEAILRPLGPLL